MKRLSKSETSKRRRGVISVIVVVVLMLIMALVAQYTRKAIADRRQVKTESQYQQTVQLAEAGILRLQQQREADGDYTGETWTLPSGTVHQTNSAQVVITIKDDEATIVARYPFNVQNPLKITRRVVLK